MTLRKPALLLVLATCISVALPGIGRPGELPKEKTQSKPVDFSRDVLPILSDNCFHCHGPDPKTRKGDLRLDTKEGAFREVDGTRVIVAGTAEKSELFRRLVTHDPTEKMPPRNANRVLTPAQIETIRRWVNQGAAWGGHWAFERLKAPSVPTEFDAKWVRGPLDRYVSARLKAEGLQPSPETDKATWLRRVTFDLTGVPPTHAELDAFLKDESADAYSLAVDRLFRSTRYGERMAADWLDLARFADTHGYQSDRFRPVWPYRDWVIRSFNRNQRFDEFLTWQLAGDLLPGAGQEQRLATAFNRLHMQNEEGGVVEEEFRVAYVADRVNTFATTFLGLTTECSRCHDHKYDPLTQRDFYGLFAFFQNIDESGQTSYFTSSTPVPALLLSNDEQDRKIAELSRAVEKATSVRDEAAKSARQRFEQWLKAGHAESLTGLSARFNFDRGKGNSIANSVDPKKPGSAVDNPGTIVGPVGSAAALDGENGFTFPGLGHFRKSRPFTIALWVRPSIVSPRAVVLHHSRAPIDAGSRGYELLIEDGMVAFGMHHMWPGNSLKVRTRSKLAKDAWTHLAVVHDGSARASGLRVFVNGETAELTTIRDGLTKDIHYDGSEPNLEIGKRFRDNGFKGGAVDELVLAERVLSPLEIRQLAGKGGVVEVLKNVKKSDGDLADLFNHYLYTIDGPTISAQADLTKAREALAAFIHAIPEIMVMKELPIAKPAFVLKRGEYDQRGDTVLAGVPKFLPPMAADWPKNRLGLARWLTQPDHPLTARVTVNRLWQQMFGTGLVESADNFGSQGSQPSHPELLDHLATDFIAGGWDVRRMLKSMALSATYRQSSRMTPMLQERDPENRLLARMSARRLSAEMVRDQALFASGLLVEQLGGPSVYPYQPDGLWNEAMGRPNYPRSRGPDLYRRSLYTIWKRTAPHPSMTTFDAADRSVCSARRQSTSTPLQSLALLNDPQLVEAARLLGRRAIKEGGATPAERIRWLFRTVASRLPTEREAAIWVELEKEQRAIFVAQPASAAKLLKVGDTPADPAIPAVDTAVWTMVASAVLSHDASVMRR